MYGTFNGARLQLYLDDQQRPRRLIASLVGSNPTVDVSYRDWAGPVPAVAPPTDGVVDRRA